MPSGQRETPRRRTARHAAHPAAHLRGLNLQRVLDIAMERPGPFTRSEIIQSTGLSAPTVGSLTSVLIRRGMIRDLGEGPSSGGRRPAFMEFNARHGFAVGIDIGPTRTRLAVADLRGEMVANRVVETPSQPCAEEVLAHLAGEVRTMLRQARVARERVLAVGAGAPAVVDPARGTVLGPAPNLPGWANVPMAAILQRALEVPVFIENDVNLAVLGERWRGAARGHDNCAFITIGTGIGAGIIVGGELLHGHHFLAGEIGFMCMGPEYFGRDFAGRGCLETLAGLKGLAARWSPPPDIDGSSRIAALFAAARAGDARARAVVDETTLLLGIATAHLTVVLDPSVIVLGGALVAEGDPHVAEEVRRVVARIVPAANSIVVSALGKEAPLWGALLLAVTKAREALRQQLGGFRPNPSPAETLVADRARV